MAQPPPLKKPKRVHPWRNEYARDFGVRVLDRDASSGDVLAVECRFCAVFGREERVLEGDEKTGVVPVNDDQAQAALPPTEKSPDDTSVSGKSPPATTVDANSNSNSGSSTTNSGNSKEPPREKKSRARTRSIATWKKSFRSDNMRSHHLEQHPRKWREYQQLLTHVKKEQALHGFLLQPPAKGSDGDDGDGGRGEGDQSEELVYSQQLSAFFGDPTSSASEYPTDPVVAAAFNPPLSTPSRHERKVPRAKSNITSSNNISTPAQPAQQQQDQDKSVLQVMDSSAAVLVLTEITSPAIVEELVPSLFDTTQRDDEDNNAKKTLNGSSADQPDGSAASPRQAPASSSSVVVLQPVYNSERATSIAQVSNGAESSSNNGGECATTVLPSDQPVSKYGVALKSMSEYSYVRQLLTLGGSVTFDQIAKIVAISRAQFKLESRLRSTSQEDIREYAKLVVATDLQMIADMMRSSWAYSLALQCPVRPASGLNDEVDDSAENGSAIEVRVRFPSSQGTDVEDFHLITVPYPSPVESAAAHGFSSADAAALITKTLSVLDPNWQKKLIGVCDEVPMRCMEVVSSVVDVIEGAAAAPFYRVLRGADLMETSLLKALDGLLANTEKGTSDQVSSVGFLESLDAVVQYLHGQQQWSKTHGVCPNLRTNKRLSAPWLLLETLQWFVTRRELIGQLQSEIEPPLEAKLSAEWWVICLALSDVLSDYQSMYRALSDNNDDTDKPEQQQRPPSNRAVLTQFVQDETVKLGIARIEQAHQVDHVAEDEASLRLKRFRWTKDSIVAFFRSLNLSTRRLYSNLSPEEQANVVHQVGRFVLQSLNVISVCTSKRRSSSDDPPDVNAAAEDAIPLTRPLDFVAIERSAVVDFIEHHSARLELSYDLAFIDGVSKQIKDLRELVADNPRLKASLIETRGKSFREAWEPLEGFSSTRALAAGFATAMPRSHEHGAQLVSTSSSSSRLAPTSSPHTEVLAHARQIEDVEKTYKLFQTGNASKPLL